MMVKTREWKHPGQEFDGIGDQLANKTIVYLYGAGGNAQRLLKIFSFMQKYIPWHVFLVDQDQEKQHVGCRGCQVLSPEHFYSSWSANAANAFVVVTPGGDVGTQIAVAMQEHDIPQQDVYDFFTFIFHHLPIYFLYKHGLVWFTSESIIPTTVCNLNCRDCLNFTPYITKAYSKELDEIERSIDLFFQAVDYIYVFQITGGEPFLYRNLNSLLQYIHSNYGSRIIQFELVANGTVIPSEEVCQTLKACDVLVILDDYRMSLPDELVARHAKVVAQLERFGVAWRDNYVPQWIRLYTSENLPQQRSVAELQQLYAACGNPWSTLEKNYISSCNYALYAANAGVVTADDTERFALDTYTPDKKKELLEFRLGYNPKGYVNLCKYCNGWTSINHELCQPAIQVARRDDK